MRLPESMKHLRFLGARASRPPESRIAFHICGRDARAPRGFTFIEIMIVIVIIGILMALTMPKVSGMLRRGKLEASVRDLMGALREARNTAISRGDGCELTIFPDENKFQISTVHLDLYGNPAEERKKTRTEKKKDYKLDNEATEMHQLQDHVYFTLIYSSAPLEDGYPRFIFRQDGSATGGQISLQDAENRALNVAVYGTTGMPAVKKGDPILPPNAEPLFVLPDKVQYQFATAHDK